MSPSVVRSTRCSDQWDTPALHSSSGMIGLPALLKTHCAFFSGRNYLRLRNLFPQNKAKAENFTGSNGSSWELVLHSALRWGSVQRWCQLVFCHMWIKRQLSVLGPCTDIGEMCVSSLQTHQSHETGRWYPKENQQQLLPWNMELRNTASKQEAHGTGLPLKYCSWVRESGKFF